MNLLIIFICIFIKMIKKQNFSFLFHNHRLCFFHHHPPSSTTTTVCVSALPTTIYHRLHLRQWPPFSSSSFSTIHHRLCLYPYIIVFVSVHHHLPLFPSTPTISSTIFVSVQTSQYLSLSTTTPPFTVVVVHNLHLISVCNHRLCLCPPSTIISVFIHNFNLCPVSVSVYHHTPQ